MHVMVWGGLGLFVFPDVCNGTQETVVLVGSLSVTVPIYISLPTIYYLLSIIDLLVIYYPSITIYIYLSFIHLPSFCYYLYLPTVHLSTISVSVFTPDYLISLSIYYLFTTTIYYLFTTTTICVSIIYLHYYYYPSVRLSVLSICIYLFTVHYLFTIYLPTYLYI